MILISLSHWWSHVLYENKALVLKSKTWPGLDRYISQAALNKADFCGWNTRLSKQTKRSGCLAINNNVTLKRWVIIYHFSTCWAWGDYRLPLGHDKTFLICLSPCHLLNFNTNSASSVYKQPANIYPIIWFRSEAKVHTEDVFWKPSYW